MHTHRLRRNEKLPAEFRGWMESRFEQELGNVRVSPWPASRKFKSAAACTDGDQIFIRSQWYQPETRLGRLILAHELAHVIQKRNGLRKSKARLPAASHWQLEAEASAAAVHVVTGRKFRCRLADHSHVSRFWAVAGHYYTTYFVLMAAGVEQPLARKLAYWSQLPDLVNQLDAIWSGIDLAKNKLSLAASYAAAGAKMRGDILDFAQIMQAKHDIDAARRRYAEEASRDLAVQTGLHCLTGGSSKVETTICTNRLKAFKLDSFEFGVGIHTYGDSFAHRRINNPSLMYDQFYGHATEVFSLTLTLPWDHAHFPDRIDQRKVQYHDFVSGLFEIAAAKIPHAKTRKFSSGEDVAQLLVKEVAGLKKDPQQIIKLRELAKNHGIPMKQDDSPPDATVDQKSFAHILAPKSRIKQALDLAFAWSSPANRQANSGAPGKTPNNSAKKTHTVMAGETLSKISLQRYGQAARWQQIYQANQKLIGPNPDLIKPGQVLVIP